jgi:GntR family transcriptional regulator, rspAB operon transcriptional repressor
LTRTRSQLAKYQQPSGSAFTLLPSRRDGAREAVTVGERIYRAFKLDIIHGAYHAGECLSEEGLAARYNSSRTPVRDVAVRLQYEHLLRIVTNRGYLVPPITLQVLNDIFEFRCAVECEAADLAALKGSSPEDLRELLHLSEETSIPDNRKRCVRLIEADTNFHITIARLSRNQMLVQAVSQARSQMERIFFTSIDMNHYGKAQARGHREIVEAIQHRDPERARQRMHQHLVESKQKILSLTGFSPRCR